MGGEGAGVLLKLKGEEEEANWVDPYSCSTGILTDRGRRDKNDLQKREKKGEEEKKKVEPVPAPLSKDRSRRGREKKKTHKKIPVPLD